MVRSLIAVILLVAMTASTGATEAARQITWDNLVPDAPPLEDPFAPLTPDQRTDLETLGYIRMFQAKGVLSDVSELSERAVELSFKLESAGLDVKTLLARYAALNAEVERRNAAVVGELEGQLVRLPGYALPLEFTESGNIKEFLLVPYVGACIHVPPPPQNQTVFVRLNKDFEVDDMFIPVWVTGRMTVKPTSKELFLIDGQSDVAAGYTLDGTKVEPYEE